MQHHNLLVISKGPHHIAVFKPHDLAVVGGRGVPRPTLLDLVRDKFGASVFPVHRLDRATSGITIFARSIFAKHAIENAFKKRLVKKTYFALCEGVAQFKKITVNDALKKVELKSKKGPPAKQIIDSSGEKAATNFKLIKKLDGGFSLIEANPISGRMHQIRAHLAHLGLPIVGDMLYGAKTKVRPHTIALCAVGLVLPLPKGGVIDLDARKYFDPSDYLDS